MSKRILIAISLAIFVLAGCSASQFRGQEGQKQNNKSDEPSTTQQEVVENDTVIQLDVYIDYQDQFSKRLYLTLNELLQKYDGQLEVAYKQFPLTSIHPDSQTAARAALCAADQGKFLEMNDKLLRADTDKVSDQYLKQYAEEINLEPATFAHCINTKQYEQPVTDDINTLTELELNFGVPTIIVDNRLMLRGAHYFATFDNLISQLLRSSYENEMWATVVTEMTAEQQQSYTRKQEQTNTVDTTQKKSLLVISSPNSYKPTEPEFVPVTPAPTDISVEPWKQAGILHLDVYIDYQDPFSKRYYTTLQQIQEKFGNKIEIYYKHYPLEQIHPDAYTAALAALCASDQGKFLLMNDRLLKAQKDKMSYKNIQQYAYDAGLNVNQLDSCVTHKKYSDRISRDKYQLDAPGLSTGTPHTVINNEFLVKGSYSIENLTQILTLILSGTPNEIEENLSTIRLTNDQTAQYRYAPYAISSPKTSQNTITAVTPQKQVQRYNIPATTLPQYFTGAKNGNIQIVMFAGEFSVFSPKMYTTLTKMIEKYPQDIRFELRFMSPSGINTELTQLQYAGAYCAGAENKFWEYVDALFDGLVIADYTLEFINKLDACKNNEECLRRVSTQVTETQRQDLLNYIKKIGKSINLSDRFMTCVQNDTYTQRVIQTIDNFTSEGIVSSPTTFINGRELRGSLPFSMIEGIIEQEKLLLETK